MKKMANGELTAFLSLVFLLLLTLVGAVLESASIQVLKNEKRADAGRAVESVFAEYQRELLEEYAIFAVEGSYETGTMSEENILNRLSWYGAENMDKDVEKIEYLTDDSGREFYRQAVEYERVRTGAAALEDLTGNLSVWKEQEKKAEEYGKENTETREKLERMLDEEDQTLPSQDNPLDAVSQYEASPLLDQVLPENFSLSQKAVDVRRLASRRELRSGHGVFEEAAGRGSDAIFFNLYLLDQFGCAAEPREGRALDYELEYLLEGEPTDAENLKAVAGKILLFRFAVNYGYLQMDAAKKGEAEALAAVLCSLFLSPEIAEAATQALLLAWAYGESVMDVRSLLAGKRVALIKDAQTWQLPLSGLLTLGAKREGMDAPGGISYQRYLQMLLLLEKKEPLTMRAIDLVEQNLQVGREMTWFQADACVTAAEFSMTCHLRRGVQYHFQTEFQYQ